MSRSGILVLVLVASLQQAQAASFFGGIVQYSEYESSLPCTATTDQNCQSVHGAMGYALDQASQAGLDISKVVEKPGNKKSAPRVFVTTKKFGVCRVETNSLQDLGPLGFACSSRGFKGDNLANVDRVFSLTQEDENYELSDVTHSSKLKSGL